MAISPRATQYAQKLRQPSVQTTVGASLPAPVKGVNYAAPVMQMDPLDAIFMYNMTPSELGCRVREGYIDWAEKTVGGLGAVKSILPYYSRAGTIKLFAVTKDGVYDITSSTTSPTLVVDYGAVAGFVKTGNAGWCSSAQFVNTAGSYLLVCDEENGYFYYDGSSWTTAPTLSGSITDPKLAAHVAVWKNRVWLTEQDNGNAHYLATAAISGAATVFQFGSKFKHGGYLKGIYNFTKDGGNGIDDFLVAIGAGGDVLIYEGYDPSSASTFDLKGSWYIGDVPAGRRLASDFGSDLLILSAYGIVSAFKLLAGLSPDSSNFYVTYKITRLMRDIMKTDRTSRGWEIVTYAREGVMIVNTPKRGSTDYLQFVMDLNTQGWGIWRGVPMYCAAVWQNALYFGTDGIFDAGAIHYMDGSLDNVRLAGGNDGQVAFALLTSFQTPGNQGTWKQVLMSIPRFLAEIPPSFNAIAKYDYDATEITTTLDSAPVSTGSLWDTGKWDIAVWSATDALTPTEDIIGSGGMGRHVAIALKGATASRTIFTGFDIMYREGGLL